MEPNEVEVAQPAAAPAKSARPVKQTIDKYAEARLAKKKQRRRAHRKTIGRPNTGG